MGLGYKYVCGITVFENVGGGRISELGSPLSLLSSKERIFSSGRLVSFAGFGRGLYGNGYSRRPSVYPSFCL